MKSKSFLISAIILISAIVALNPSIAKADILVYDNNNQYLGIVLELSGTHMSVFIPSVEANMDFHYWLNEICEYGNAVFESSDCSGPPYSDGPLPQVFDLSPTRGAYYKPTYSGIKTFKPDSYYDDNCECQQNTLNYPDTEYYPLIQVQLPFTMPIELPLSFKVQTITETVTKTETVMFPIVVPLRQKPKP